MMEVFENDSEPTSRGQTIVVLGLMGGASLLASWLAAYGLSEVLITSDLLSPWPAGTDPRPEIMMKGFIGLMTTLMACVFVGKLMSQRQLRSIDRMAED